MPDVLVKANASIDDTINLIAERIQMDYNTPWVAKACELLNASDPDQTAFLKRLQDYVYRNVNYILDPLGTERVYRPTTTISNGVGDCKKMSVIIGSVLQHAGIPAYLKHVTYADDEITHIYVIVPSNNTKGYLTLDPVNNPIFNNEVTHATSRVYDLKGNRMNLVTGFRNQKYNFQSSVSGAAASIMDDISVTAGCGSAVPAHEQAMIAEIFAEEPTISGIGKKSKEEKQKKREQRKEKRANAANKLAKVGLAPARKAVLIVVQKNFFRLADKLVRAFNKNKSRVENFWKSFGGDPLDLKNAAIEGSGQAISGTGAVVLATALATAGPIVATATPIIIKLKDLFTELGILKPGEDEELEDGIEMGEDEANKSSFKVPVTLNSSVNVKPKNAVVPKTKPAPSTPTPANNAPTPGSFALSEIDSYATLVYCIVKSAVYSFCIANLFRLFVNDNAAELSAGIVTVASIVWMGRKFFKSQVLTALQKIRAINNR